MLRATYNGRQRQTQTPSTQCRQFGHISIDVGCSRYGKSLNGGQGQNRTADTGIFSPLLYRLSYLAIRYLRSRVLDLLEAEESTLLQEKIRSGSTWGALPLGFIRV